MPQPELGTADIYRPYNTHRAILVKSPNRPAQSTRRLMIEATYQI